MPRIGEERVQPRQKITAGFLGASVRFMGSIVNLSESGVLLSCSESLALQTTGRFGIIMGHAFQFIQMSPHDREQLHRLLYNLRKENLA